MGIVLRLRQRRLAIVAATAAVVVGSLTTSAFGLVNGAPDAGHRYVGMAFSPGGALCTGSLVSSRIFVTAAHCFENGSIAFVNMEQDAIGDLQSGGAHVVPGFVTVHPGWRAADGGLSGSDLNDVAVIQLFAPVVLDKYATLPSRIAYDDSLPNNQAVEIVGYGVRDAATQTGFGTRLKAGAKIIPGGGATGGEFLKISSSPGQGGATCFGDSGGPVLLAGTDLMVAISSYGPSATCKAVAYSQRMDTPAALGFVNSFLR